MLTQPVLVARLSTHAWALGKGPALFSLRHRDGEEKLWKSWVLPQEWVCVHICVCVFWGERLTLGMGIAEMHGPGKMMFLLNYEMNSLPVALLHFFFHSVHLAQSSPSSSSLPGFWRAAVHGAESFITHFVHVFFRILGSNPCPTLAALQKQCIQFVSTKSVPALGSPPQKGEAYHSRRFKKAAGNTACSQKQ